MMVTYSKVPPPLLPPTGAGGAAGAGGGGQYGGSGFDGGAANFQINSPSNVSRLRPTRIAPIMIQFMFRRQHACCGTSGPVAGGWGVVSDIVTILSSPFINRIYKYLGIQVYKYISL